MILLGKLIWFRMLAFLLVPMMSFLSCGRQIWSKFRVLLDIQPLFSRLSPQIWEAIFQVAMINASRCGKILSANKPFTSQARSGNWHVTSQMATSSQDAPTATSASSPNIPNIVPLNNNSKASTNKCFNQHQRNPA